MSGTPKEVIYTKMEEPIYRDKFERHWHVGENPDWRTQRNNFGIYVREKNGIDSDCTRTIMNYEHVPDREEAIKYLRRFAARQNMKRVAYVQ